MRQPGLTLGRVFSDTFPAAASIPGLIAAQIVGAAVAIGLIRARRVKTQGQPDT